MALECVYRNGRLTISRNGKQIANCKPYDREHAIAIAEKFKAWAAQGWPYKLRDDR